MTRESDAAIKRCEKLAAMSADEQKTCLDAEKNNMNNNQQWTLIPGDTQPKRGEPIPLGLMTDVDVYVKWYNERPNRAKCSICGEMVHTVKSDDGIPVLNLIHKPDCVALK